MTSIPTIILQAPTEYNNHQTTSGSHQPIVAEIRIVLMQGSSTTTNRRNNLVHQIPLMIQLPMQKQRKRCGRKKPKPKPKQQTTTKQDNTTQTNEIEVDILSPLPDINQESLNNVTENSALVELIQQHESTNHRSTTCDIITTASKAVQVPYLDTPCQNDVEPTSDNAFWRSIDDDIDRMFSEPSNEELAPMINQVPAHRYDLLDELLS